MVTQKAIRKAQDHIRRMTPEVYDYAYIRNVVAEDCKTQSWFVRGLAVHLTPENEQWPGRDKELRAIIAKEHFESTGEVVAGNRLTRMMWQELGYDQ